MFDQLKLHKCITLSTTKTKFITIIEVYKELPWINNLLNKLSF